MNVQQLRYLVAIHQSDLSITAAARSLSASQPGVSRQIKELETELGLQLFERAGRALIRTTAAGEEIVSRARSVLREIDNIREASEERNNTGAGVLSIATTHTQARYILPEVLRSFLKRYPKVKIHIHQGSSEQIAEMVESDAVDVAIATDSGDLFPRLVRLPAFRWHRCIVVPRGHPLAGTNKLTLQDIAQHPIVTYEFSLSGRSSLLAQFKEAGLSLDVALTAQDSDVLKTYVRVGLGVGIMAPFAVEPDRDSDLLILDATHLFNEHITWIGYRRSGYLRAYMYDFIEGVAPHIDQRLIRRSEAEHLQDGVDKLVRDLTIPSRDRPGSERKRPDNLRTRAKATSIATERR